MNREEVVQREENRVGVLDADTWEHCRQRVMRLALRITRNQEDAEDAQQEALLKAHRNLSQFEGRSRFTTWVSRIAINEALMCIRKRRNAVFVPLEDTAEDNGTYEVTCDLPSETEDPETAYSQKERRELLMKSLCNLSPSYRAVFLLRVVEYCSVSETARKLHVSPSTVKMRLRRARTELREMLSNVRPAFTQ